MKKKLIGICICMLLIATVIPVVGTINEKVTKGNKIVDNQFSMEFIPGEFIVKVKQGRAFSSPALMALNAKYQVNALEKVFPHSEGTILDNIYLLHVPINSDIRSIVNEYSLCPDVVYAEPNGIGHPCSIPNDANFSNQWYLHNTGQVFCVWNGHNYSGKPDADIDAPEAWDMEKGSSSVVIAIIGTGIDYTHPEFIGKLWNNTDEIPNNGIDDDNNGYIDDVMGWDFYNNDSDPKDMVGHETHISGIVGAGTNNSIGVAGICWDCRIMPVEIYDADIIWLAANAAKGIVYAVDNGADVMSISSGSNNPYNVLLDAVNYAHGKGVFFCAAAGNSNSNTKTYPAAYDNVTAVAATNQYDQRCGPGDWGPGSGSQYGDWLDIAAPGNFIFSTTPTYHVLLNDWGMSENYSIGRGTSFASPIVAGVAALLLSKDPSLTPDEVKALLCGNVDPYNSTEYIGTGRLNAQKALIALNQPPAPPIITGPAKGKIKVPTEYNFTTTDPDGDQVYYFIDWGDHTNSSWIGPYPSGDIITESHTWTTKGTYAIKAKAKDIYRNESGWGTLSVTMPLSYEPPHFRFFEWLFERFPHAFPILKHLLGY
jgi:subtilisin family serine protease